MRQRMASARVLLKTAAKRCSCRPVEGELSALCRALRGCVEHLVAAVGRRRVRAVVDRRLGGTDAVEDGVLSS